MDAADRAQIQIEREEAQRRRVTDDRPAVSAERCRDCCEEIPAARRAAVPGCTRCAGCDQDHEREVRR